MNKTLLEEKICYQIQSIEWNINDKREDIVKKIEWLKRDCDEVLRKMEDKERSLNTLGEFQNVKEIDRLICEVELLREFKKDLELSLKEEKEEK